METCYLKNLDRSQSLVKIEDSAFKHIKALRLKVGDKIDLTAGSGFIAESVVESFEKYSCVNRIISVKDNFSENDFNITLALGILDVSDRLEFALEKAIELGITKFIPLLCQYSQKKTIRTDRLISKSIAALEQCKRSTLPFIEKPQTVKQVLNNIKDSEKIILADIDGVKPSITEKSDILLFIGPEGGFSKEEIDCIKANNNTSVWRLSRARLRAETAAISGLSTINSLTI